MPLPTIETERLTLRPFTLDDAEDVQRLAGERDVADTTQNIPHPYRDGMAEQWIEGREEAFESQEGLALAIVRRSDGELVGAVGLSLSLEERNAEIGYWIGKPYWNRGYATEAAGALLRYGFAELGLHRIQARHMMRNPASGRVLEKLGMRREGILREAAFKWGEYEDVATWAILEDEAGA